MPFFQDIGADDEALQRPIWGVFALAKDNLERLVATNIGWAIQLLPALAALGFSTLPAVVRVLLILYSVTVLAPATGLLFVWMGRICQQEPFRLEMFREDIRALALPSFISLAPLFGGLGVCYIAILLLGLVHILLLDILVRFAFLLLWVCALYWGPLFAANPGRSPFFLLGQSLRLFWLYPGATVLTGLIVLLAAALGVISIGGFFLIVPVIIALLQTSRFYELMGRERTRRRRFKVDIV